MNRRKFVAAGIAGICFWFFIPLHRVRSIFNRLKKRSGPTQNELKTATRIAEYIYPADDLPGATSLGIEIFFSEQFQTPYYRQYIPALKRLCRFLDKKCRKEHSCGFLAADPSIQNELIHTLSSEQTIRQNPGIQKDFNALVDITLEGCFSDPMHGGNREKNAWRILTGTVNEEWFNV